MTEDEAKQWAAALIESQVQYHLTDLDPYFMVEEEASEQRWPEGAIDQVIDLIDTATCTIEVDWPPRVKGRPLQ